MSSYVIQRRRGHSAGSYSRARDQQETRGSPMIVERGHISLPWYSVYTRTAWLCMYLVCVVWDHFGSTLAAGAAPDRVDRHILTGGGGQGFGVSFVRFRSVRGVYSVVGTCRLRAWLRAWLRVTAVGALPCESPGPTDSTQLCEKARALGGCFAALWITGTATAYPRPSYHVASGKVTRRLVLRNSDCASNSCPHDAPACANFFTAVAAPARRR